MPARLGRSFPAPKPLLRVGPQSVPSIPSYTFQDEFDGSSLDTDKWIAIDRAGDIADVNWYLPANVTVAGGLCSLTVKVEASHGKSYTGGLIMWKTFNFNQGYLEVRARMGSAEGSWPAIWLLGAGDQPYYAADPNDLFPPIWPNYGADEIDVAEFVSQAPPFDDDNQQIHNDIGSDQHVEVLSPEGSTNFHIYGLDWQAGSLTWYVDGVQTFQVTGSHVYDSPKFLIIQNAVAGVTPNDATFPSSVEIDYVRVNTQPLPSRVPIFINQARQRAVVR